MVNLLHSIKPENAESARGSSAMVAPDLAQCHTVAGVDADRELARAIDLAEAENVVELAVSRQRWYPDLHVSWLWTERAVSVFAGHWTHLTSCMLSHPGVTQNELASIEKFFFDFDATTIIHVPSFDAEAQRMLRLRGYTHLGAAEVVFHSLDDLPPFDPSAPIEDLSPDLTAAWIEALASRDGIGPERLEAGGLVSLMKGAHKFAAFADGNVAGGGSMRLVDDVALFFCDGVVPKYRSRGLHRLLILARMHAAKAAGVRIAGAFVHPGSQSARNYLSLGFERLYLRDTYQLIKP
jgi:hypothetical protein